MCSSTTAQLFHGAEEPSASWLRCLLTVPRDGGCYSDVTCEDPSIPSRVTPAPPDASPQQEKNPNFTSSCPSLASTLQEQAGSATMAASRTPREPSADPNSQLQAEQAQASSTAPQQPTTTDEQPATEPASPPLPQRHTAVTPGPRASRFREVYAQSLKRTLGKAGWENFKGCYPTVAGSAEGVLRQVQGQMVEKLGEKCEVSSVLFFFYSPLRSAKL